MGRTTASRDDIERTVTASGGRHRHSGPVEATGEHIGDTWMGGDPHNPGDQTGVGIGVDEERGP